MTATTKPRTAAMKTTMRKISAKAATKLSTPASPHEAWSGSFGNSYHERNRVDWRARVEFWQSAIEFCTPATVFELGCGPGWNLRAIQQCAPNTGVFGADLNQQAVDEARAAGLEVQLVGQHGIAGLYEPGSMDIVCTAGCLIHVPPADLSRTMQDLIELSGRYVLAIEYQADQEEEVEYRGQMGLLWKRPYGKLYQDLGLVLLSEGVAGGFDACNYALLEKPQPEGIA